MAILETAMLRNIVIKKLLLAKAATMQIKDADVDKEVSAEYDKLKGASSDADFDQQLKAVGVTTSDLRARLREKVLIEDVLASQTTNVEPTEQEIDEIYMKYKDSFNIPAKVRASRVLILVDDKTSPADKAAKKKAIDKARLRVIQGDDFSKVAMEVSEDKYSAPKGGDIGYFQRNENEPGFDDVAFNTKVDTISPVFVTALGYQFIKVTAIQPAGTVPVSEARNVIAAKLREMKTQQQGQAYAQKLMADSNVTYHIVLVDPPAQPSPASAPAQPTATGDSTTAAPTSAPASTPAPAPDTTTNTPAH
jgi:parvulin-like peptidyl-prolyl isomerase